MLVFNIMMSRGLGGIEQAYIDYSNALEMQGHKIINISSIGAKINSRIKNSYKLPNLSIWCVFSRIILKILIIIYKPKAIICHGNRAISFAKAFNYKKPIIIGVSHNYSYKYLKKCDYVIALTTSLKKHLLEHGFKEQKLLSLPNMLNIANSYDSKAFSNPIVIGSIGRFVEKKGFLYLIEAISILKKNGHTVKLLIGGDGVEKSNLENKIKELGLEKQVSFYGWVHNKKLFFEKIDIFCLPSLVEPFGIIILEAIEYSKPLVVTRSGGPEEIIHHQKEGLISEVKSAESLAMNLEKLVNNPGLAHKLSENAYTRLKENYDMTIVSYQLSSLLNKVTD